MPENSLYVGLISGTSVDGVDCALVDFAGEKPTLVSTHFEPSPEKLRDEVLKACSGDQISPAALGQLDNKIGQFFAAAALELLNNSKTDIKDVVAIGSHGQTIWHKPDGSFPFTLQLGDPNAIAYLTGITTVADFRRMDMAAGGQGAPLAPLLHQSIFQSPEVDRAVVNIGGISNLTCLPASGQNLAFDTGPGNVLMDYWINKHQQKRYDKNGDWARHGKAQTELLNQFLSEPFLKIPHPKSTGRELFNGRWLESILDDIASISAIDVQATLLEFTATTIASEIQKLMTPAALYVCGGGAQNGALMDSLASKLGSCEVASTDTLGVHPDWVEAVAFAWMARERIADRPIKTNVFTGAKKPVVLGGIYSALH